MPKLDYTARDFESNVEALEEFVRTAVPDKWNSYASGDLGKVLLEAIAYDHAILSYLLDQQARESFIDTLRFRESLLHFVRLSGYQLRRSTSASIEVYAEAASPPTYPQEISVRRGTQVKSLNGLSWEVDGNYIIESGKRTPVRRIIGYGDITAKNLDDQGAVQEVKALIKLEKGKSTATLVNLNGERFSSEFGFGQVIGQGHILKLGSEYDQDEERYTTSPRTGYNEFAIVDVGKFTTDAYDRSVLFLERVWELDDWYGKWVIENRNIRLVQGETKKELFTVPTDLGDRKNHSIRASFYPVVGSQSEGYVTSGDIQSASVNSGIVVTVNGILWQETSSLLFETSTSLAYEVDFDEKDRLVITFGDGNFGSVLPSGAVVSVTYRIGGGAIGNVSQGTFNTSVGVGSDTIFLTNNYTVGRGGQDREDLRVAKRNIPKFIRTNDRGVSVADYGYLASNFTDPRAGRIKLAKAVLHKNAVPRENNIIWVYAWAQGANGQLTAPTILLKRALLEYMEVRKMMTDEIVIVDGRNVNIPIGIRYKYSRSADEAEVDEQIISAINGVLKNQEPGCPLQISDLYGALDDIDSLDHFSLTSPTNTIIPSSEFELFVNTLQNPLRTRLLQPAVAGNLTVVVENPDIFTVGGILSIWQSGKETSVGTVVNKSSNIITLREDVPLIDSYSEEYAVVNNSDYWPMGWQYETRVNVYVKYENPTSSVDELLERRIIRYFREELLPESDLNKSDISRVVASTSGVGEYSVNFNSVDGTVEKIPVSSREKAVIGTLIINGRVVASNC